MAKMKLVGALSAMTVATVMGQSCVQLSATEFSSCPCEDAMFTFALEGETTVEANRVSGRVGTVLAEDLLRVVLEEKAICIVIKFRIQAVGR